METCWKISAGFYARAAQNETLRHLFPGSLRCQIEAFAWFLIQFLGGPCEYSEQRWTLSLRESHARFRIGMSERDAWLYCMRATLDELRIEEPARGALLQFFGASAAYVVNHPRGAIADPPAEDGAGELAQRWNVQRKLDEIVAAVRRGDGPLAIELIESSPIQAYLERDRSALLNLLAMMGTSGNVALFDFVRQTLVADPALVSGRYAHGRTLLHAASGAGNLPMVEVLLELGSDPDARDQGGHRPLYCAANACAPGRGADVVRALVAAGAQVDAADGVKHCTALHMAARRGNVEIGAVLLDCGANIEAHDSRGDTPLRRAVNCRKPKMIEMLLARGADPASKRILKTRSGSQEL